MNAIAAGHRAIAYDRRGFGDTTFDVEPHSHVDDLLSILDAMEIDAAVLVGNSQGGRIAIDTALAHPIRVQALVLVAPAISGAPEPDSVPPEEAALDEAFEAAGDDVDAVNDIEAHAWLDGAVSARGRVSGDARELFLDMNGRALRSPDPGPERESPSAYERLAQITQRTRVLVGSLDLEHVRANAAYIADRVPNASLATLDGVAHLPQLERPAVFSDELSRFLRG